MPAENGPTTTAPSVTRESNPLTKNLAFTQNGFGAWPEGDPESPEHTSVLLDDLARGAVPIALSEMRLKGTARIELQQLRVPIPIQQPLREAKVVHIPDGEPASGGHQSPVPRTVPHNGLLPAFFNSVAT